MPPTKRRRRNNIVLKVATGGLRGPVVKNLTASQAAKYSESMKSRPNGLYLPPRRQNNAVDDIRYPQDQEDENQNPMQSSATSQSIVKAATIEPFASGHPTTGNSTGAMVIATGTNDALSISAGLQSTSLQSTSTSVTLPGPSEPISTTTTLSTNTIEALTNDVSYSMDLYLAQAQKKDGVRVFS